MFFIKSKLSITAYLFLVLYRSRALQSRSFLQNIETFLCKQKLVNNRRIPSTHAERKITVCSHKHSCTPYPSLSPYSQTEQRIEEQIHLLCMGWRIFFPVVILCQFFGCGRKQFQVLLTYHTSCAVVSFFWLQWEIVLGCTDQIFGCGGKQFYVLLTYLPYQLCRCVSFLVAVGNSFGLHSF